jgi:hypothetical protein
MDGRERTIVLIHAMTVAIGATAIVMLLYSMITPSSDPKPEERFKVVDTYKNCNVIRYTDSTSRWHYFFRCST